MTYSKGLHILLTVKSDEHACLLTSAQWDLFVSSLIRKNRLQCVGEICHNFKTGGFTAVYALTESHLSIHTWPEYGLCTCDVFLSNFRQNNHEKVRNMADDIIAFFKSADFEIKELER